jgi:cystathionine beta-lyase/cystathionine gamma-synthase
VVARTWSVKETNDPFVVPSFETISFSLPSIKSWKALLTGEQDGWMYSSYANPTLSSLEELLARVQGVESCWVTSTGKSAIASTLMALLKAGDHIVLLREGYKSTRLFTEGVLQRFGVSCTLIGIDEIKRLPELIKPGQSKILVLESPTNPMTRVPDLRYCVDIAREYELTTVLDNSLSGLHQHGSIGVDLIVHSLSKYASGIGDVMGGAVLGSKDRVAKVRSANAWNTDTLSTHAAVELWKGMQTYQLRMERQSSSALTVARYLETHPRVSRVLYPGLESHPDHHIAKQQMQDFGSVLSFDVKGAAESMHDTLDRMQLFRIAFGTGFTQSIANPAFLFYGRSFPEAQTGLSAINDNTVRLSIGIESPQELIADLEASLG